MTRHYDRYPDIEERCKTVKSKTELAKSYGVSVPSISHALKRRSLVIPYDRYESLEKGYSEGHTIQELADIYGVTYAAVQKQMVKRGIVRRSTARRNQLGPNNPAWLGDKASYFGMHKRVRKIRGKPQHCENCETTRPDTKYHWASLSGNFGDPNDYKRLCVSCHAIHDNWGSRLPNPK